jgi:hypothetical protein
MPSPLAAKLVLELPLLFAMRTESRKFLMEKRWHSHFGFAYARQE